MDTQQAQLSHGVSPLATAGIGTTLLCAISAASFCILCSTMMVPLIPLGIFAAVIGLATVAALSLFVLGIVRSGRLDTWPDNPATTTVTFSQFAAAWPNNQAVLSSSVALVLYTVAWLNNHASLNRFVTFSRSLVWLGALGMIGTIVLTIILAASSQCISFIIISILLMLVVKFAYDVVLGIICQQMVCVAVGRRLAAFLEAEAVSITFPDFEELSALLQEHCAGALKDAKDENREPAIAALESLKAEVLDVNGSLSEQIIQTHLNAIVYIIIMRTSGSWGPMVSTLGPKNDVMEAISWVDEMRFPDKNDPT